MNVHVAILHRKKPNERNCSLSFLIKYVCAQSIDINSR